MDTLRDLREGLSEQQGQQLQEEAERTLGFLRDEWSPSGRTLALFSSSSRDVLEALSLQVALPALARFEGAPYLTPLDAAIEDSARLGVVVIGEREARILTTFLGELTSSDHTRDDVMGKQRQGGWAAFRFEREHAYDVQEHLRHVARAVQEQAAALPFGYLVIGGTGETVSAFRAALSPDLQARVAGTFAAEMFATDQELIDLALPIAEAAERQEEAALVRRIMERAMAGQAAALGWDETLQTLKDGRVHRLALGAANLGTSRGDRALALAWKTGAEVEFVRGEAEALLADNGGVGALLRY
jgi:peptide subunit release factor 1 (eRF1)